jgi:SSS family transporter
MLLTFIIVYLLFTLAIGWWASRKVKTTRDFVIAGQNLPLLLAGSALFATWFGSETIMGAPSEFVEHGLIGVVEDPFGAALCLLLVGLFFARPLYRMNILTFNDFFRLRFSRRTELITAIIIVPSYFGWIAAQLVAMAIVLQAIAGISVVTGIVICTLVVLFYTYIGGMWAVSITDFVQTFMILGGLLFLAWQLSDQLGGVQTVLAQTPDDFFHFLPEGDLESVLAYIAAWITIGLGSIPQQDVFQRVMAAKSEKTAVRASYLGGLMYLSIGLIPLFIGLCSKILYPGLQEGDTQMVIPQMVLQHGGMLLQILFFGALLSAILSTTSGAILAPATVIGENIIRPNFENIDDRQLLRIMRLAVIGVAVCSAFMASLKTNIYELVAQSSTLSLVSLFIPLTMGLYWRKASDVGAILSIAFGMVAWMIAEFASAGIPPILVGGIASLIGMLAGSWGWPEKDAGKYQRILQLRGKND